MAPCPILKMRDSVVCMAENAMVAGPTAETGVSACAPPLWHSAGGSAV